MTQWTRTIGRQITNLLPQWRQNMTQVNTLYQVGTGWGGASATSGVNATFQWPINPATGQPDTTYGGALYAGLNGTFDHHWDTEGGSVFIPEIGPYGMMVFGGTGEGIIVNQLVGWPLSDDNPSFSAWQQPYYTMSEADAAANGASWYYNPAEYNALQASNPNRIIPHQVGTGSSEGNWGTTVWDKQFPVGRAGWIIRGKGGPSELGRNTPYFFRYNMGAYVPASMTGASAGALVVNERSFHGSFGSSSGPPANVTAAEWWLPSKITPGGGRKFYLFARDVLGGGTPQWSVIAEVPDFVTTYSGNVSHPHAFVDRASRRLYYTAHALNSLCLYWADFSAGMGAVTMGGPVAMSGANGVGADIGQSHSHTDLFVGTSGVLAGRKLYYYRNGLGRLGMIELGSTNRIYDLTGAVGLPSTGLVWFFAIDQANARIIITTRTRPMSSTPNTVSTCTWYSCPIPSDPTVGANYTFTPTVVNMNGLVFDRGVLADWPCGHRARYHPELGVILLTNRSGPMMAYRPA